MAPPRDPSSDDSFESSAASAQSPKEYQKIVDELRNVLSGLSKSENLPSDPEPLLHEDEILRTAQPTLPASDLESEKLGEAAFRQASELEASSSPQPSDAEFWNGNVLGWTASSPEEPPPPPPPVKIEPPTRQIFSAPLPADPWVTKPVDDLPQIFKPIDKKNTPPIETDFSFPPAPIPPENNEKLDFDAESFGQFGTPDPIPPEPFQMEKKGIDPRASFMEQLQIPIPETIHQSREPDKLEKNDPVLEEMSIKPSDRIQIACLYPNGHETLSNDFILKMKTTAAKAIGFPEIEIVLTTPWFLAQINIPAWKKAASISGAHFMFVLAYRKDKDIFKDLAKVLHKEDVKTRLVFIEQINLRTLYADLLSDVMRDFNVKG